MSVHSISLKGKRPENEDQHNVIININGNDKTKNKMNLYGIYDGHGGSFVSKFLHKNIPPMIFDTDLPPPWRKDIIEQVFDYIQSLLKKKYTKNAMECGSTCLIVEQFQKGGGEYLNIINVGDSRCIICDKDNMAIPLTKDHKPSWPEEFHRINKIGGAVNFDGYDYRVKDLSLSRSIGDISAEPEVTAKPEIFRRKLDHDKFIVLGCDGLWDVLSNSDVVNFVLHNAYDMSGGGKLVAKDNIAKKLADLAIAKGSMDNVTVIVAFFE
jgi:serine/threonine protein phosphatase PrpC